MKRFLLIVLAQFVVLGSVGAQTRNTMMRIFCDPPGNPIRYYVDEVLYTSAQTFNWPVGSKHTLRIDYQNVFPYSTRYVFASWTDDRAILSSTSPSITITADPAIQYIKAIFSKEYLISLQLGECGPEVGAVCQPPGTVVIGGQSFVSNAQVWVAADSEVTLQATPSPGFVFVGWGQPLNYVTSFLHSFIIKGPITLGGLFAQGKRVRLNTDPPELMIAPNRTPTKAPAELDWADGSKNILGVVSPQTDERGRLWVFDSWSNGMGENAIYTVSTPNVPVDITAKFVPGARVSFATTPANLRLRVDGRENWPSYNFVWGVGAKHTVTAPADQTDVRGRRYQFQAWSNDGSATQEITVTNEHAQNGGRFIANYKALGQVTFDTRPTGLEIRVDGRPCYTPCRVDRDEGSQVKVLLPEKLELSEDSRLEFAGWTDAESASRQVTVGSDAVTYVANFRTLSKLVAFADPDGCAQFNYEPYSPDGFYSGDVQVAVTAKPRLGFKFKRWEGDAAGQYATAWVMPTGPRYLKAFFDRVPYVEPAGVRNAAGETPEPVVAAGSLIAIFGGRLASEYTAGPASPLAQTLGGVMVKLNDRLLPILFVSPEQINAQLPSDLAEGEYQLTVSGPDRPDAAANFTVVRNAPGLFSSKTGDISYALANDEDGAAITPEKPARRGTVVTLFGTGFGPYERAAPEGFAIPEDVGYALLDEVEVVAGDAVLPAISAGGAPGQVGGAYARFRVPDEWAAGAGVKLYLRINGRASNTVILPLE